MDILGNLIVGFSAAASLQNLFFCLVGCLLGTLIGVLPGIGPVATIAMLLPATYGLAPLTSLIMLAGIYYGAQYGGSTTAIMVNMPGETSSVVTCLDGYQMARQGRAGAALTIAALGSFFAGCVGTLILAGFAPILAAFSEKFTSVEYFSLMVLGLLSAVVMAQGSLTKAIAMIFVGLLLGLCGTDVNTGTARYTFGVSELFDGIGFLPVVMGLFGINEVMANLERPQRREALASPIKQLWLTAQDFRQAWPAVLRGTGLGSLLGILPGGGVVLASFASYTLEKKVAREPARFGRGAIEGVAGPESANNAAAQTSFIRLLTLGLPSNVVMALMMGAMIIQGIAPGAAVMDKRPDLFWGMVASMWIGNLMLLVINLPLIGIWVRLLNVPYRLLFPAILVFCLLGIYTVNNSTTDVLLTALFAVFGYLLTKFGLEPAPLVLGFILGPLMEENLRRSMVLSRGDPMIFLTRPLSLALLLMSAGVVLLVALPQFRRTRETAFQE
ncbi:MAG TPA: tripartite tricarboxylate transporter permease [Reyranella sp.]|nr:tripartite tricarboxylate transporter permease [Reyranella sp.]